VNPENMELLPHQEGYRIVDDGKIKPFEHHFRIDAITIYVAVAPEYKKIQSAKE